MQVPLHYFMCSVVVISITNGWTSNFKGGYNNLRSNESLPKLTVGLIVPHTNFEVREYNRSISKTVSSLTKSRIGHNSKFTFLKKYRFSPREVRSVMMRLTPSPTGKV